MFGFRPKLPITDAERAWVDESFDRLTNLFGRERLVEAPTVLPTADFFPQAWEPTEACASVLFDRVCELMKTNRGHIQLEFFYVDHVDDQLRKRLPYWRGSTDHGPAGFYQETKGEDAAEAEAEAVGPPPAIIAIRMSQLKDPMTLVATMAHEIAHVLLLGDRRIERDIEHMEPLTDLTTVFCGFGIFTANSAINFRQWSDTQKFGWSVNRLGYLTEPIYGYALARYAQLRHERRPSWTAHLKLNVRTYMNQSTKVFESEKR
jgi:hypothetical protein